MHGEPMTCYELENATRYAARAANAEFAKIPAKAKRNNDTRRDVIDRNYSRIKHLGRISRSKFLHFVADERGLFDERSN